MMSTVLDFTFVKSHRLIVGERPNLRGPNPSGKIFKKWGGEGIGAQSRAASVTSCPCAISDSHRRTTE